MRKALVILFLAPFVLHGQLNKMRPDMTEAEFVKVFPEAKRDLGAEAETISGNDTINGIKGTGAWRIYNDTIAIYAFDSFLAQGPSSAHPKDDSTEVHKMKMSADILRNNLEAHIGKPISFRNVPLLSVNDEQLRAYYAYWKYNDSTIVTITIERLPPGGEITRTEAEDYFLRVKVTHRDQWIQNFCSVGMSAKTFFSGSPQLMLQIDPTEGHIFRISDSLTIPDAEWTFYFLSNGGLQRMVYSASAETAHQANSNEAAYKKMKVKAEEFLAEGNSTFGKTDTLTNYLGTAYELPDPVANPHTTYLYSEWKTKTGSIMIKFTEGNSQYSEYSYFSLELIISPLD